MENILFFARKKVTMDKFSSQVKITTNSAVKKVLKVVPNSIINSCDIMADIVSISGKIKATVIYVNQNNEIDSSEMFFDFIEKQQITDTLEDIFAEDVIEVKSINFSGMDIICIFEHNLTINGNYKYEIPTSTDEKENFVTKKSQFNTLKHITSCEDNFVVAQECDTNLGNIQILSITGSVILTDVVSLVDKIAIEGKIISNTIYSDEQGIGQYSKEFEFKQEILANGTVPNMKTRAFVQVRDISVIAEDNDGKTNLIYSVNLFAKGVIYEDAEYEVIDDMFSLSNIIQTKYDFIDARTFSSMKNYVDTFLLSNDISNIENFDDILGVFLPKFNILSIDETDGKSFINANITSIALYKSGDEINELNTSLPIRLEISKDLKELVGSIWTEVEVASYKVKAGKNLEVVYNLNYNVVFENETNLKYVKSCEVKGDKVVNDSGIKIYITQKGETLFDVAKSLNIKPEIIAQQNEVFDSFEQGEKIYVYSPINLYN